MQTCCSYAVKQVVAASVNAQTCDMDTKRAAQRAYVRDAMEVTGLDATNLARRAGLSPSNLTRFLNTPDGKYLLSTRTLSAIAAVSGLPIAIGTTGFTTTPEEVEDAEKKSIAAEAFELLRKLPRSEQKRYLDYLRSDVKRLEDDG